MNRIQRHAASLALATSLFAMTAAHAATNAASAPAAAASKPGAKELAKLCDTCAIVGAVHTEQRKGKGSGVGAVGGAVVGGLLGHQVGGGTGKTVATVGGAVAGGLAGNEIEKRSKKHTVWITNVTLKNGSTRNVETTADPALRNGDIVNIGADGKLNRLP